MKVILYSTHCPICNLVSQKLKQKNITYTEINDANVMLLKGFMSAPMLEVDGQVMNSAEAINFIDNYQKRNN